MGTLALTSTPCTNERQSLHGINEEAQRGSQYYPDSVTTLPPLSTVQDVPHAFGSAFVVDIRPELESDPSERSAAWQYTRGIQLDSANSGSHPTCPSCMYTTMKNWLFPTPIIIAFVLPSVLVDPFLLPCSRDGQSIIDRGWISATATFVTDNRGGGGHSRLRCRYFGEGWLRSVSWTVPQGRRGQAADTCARQKFCH